MSSPGEVPQAIGKAYVLALIGSLEGSVKGFRRVFDVETSPEKLNFRFPSGASASFDVSGILERGGRPPREVLVECKGHRDGNKVLEGYRDFLGNAFFVSSSVERHADDSFWFATNVPFGSSFGRKLTAHDVVFEFLKNHPEAKQILQSAADPSQLVRKFVRQITVCIFPDSFMRLTGVSYLVRQDDNLWTILQKLHGGTVPVDDYQSLANHVARSNDLASPDVIIPETILRVPWLGIDWPGEDE